MANTLSLPVRLLATSVSAEVRLDLELPAELEDALDGGSLRHAFYQMSPVQKDCYVDWVGSDPTENGRRVRADLVCSVVRRLAS